jgi:hypothetical protein
MSQIVREFLARLQAEEAIFHPRLAEDTYGLAFLTAIKEFDYYYYNLIRHESSETASEHFYLMRLAIPRLVQKTFASIPSFRVPVATFRSDRSLILAALNMVARFGFVEHGKRMAHAAMAGECELVKISNSLFEFRLPEILFNYEATESNIENFHRQQRRTRRDALINQMARWLTSTAAFRITYTYFGSTSLDTQPTQISMTISSVLPIQTFRTTARTIPFVTT